MLEEAGGASAANTGAAIRRNARAGISFLNTSVSNEKLGGQVGLSNRPARSREVAVEQHLTYLSDPHEAYTSARTLQEWTGVFAPSSRAPALQKCHDRNFITKTSREQSAALRQLLPSRQHRYPHRICSGPGAATMKGFALEPRASAARTAERACWVRIQATVCGVACSLRRSAHSAGR